MTINDDNRRRIYVAGPMQGKPEHGYPAFEEACKFLKRIGGWLPISPHELHDEDDTTRGTTKTHYGYMKDDIAALATCEAIVLLDGWTKSNGARAELSAALAMGLDVWRFDTTGYAPDIFYRLD